MGNTQSAPASLYKAAKRNDVEVLRSLVRQYEALREEYRGNNIAKFLEWEDDNGCTPLLVAAGRGHYQCVELLLQHGANAHHVSKRLDGGSALHEAVANKQELVAELLLQYGCLPFVENIKGLTAADLAIKTGHTSLLRRLESHALFSGHLLVKVPRFGGLKAEWARRWVVVVPRFPCPLLPPERRNGYHAMILLYKRDDQFSPLTRVFINGAQAVAAVPKHMRQLQRPNTLFPLECVLKLHRAHAQPSGVVAKGEPHGGFALQLRPESSSSASSVKLRALMDLVNSGGDVAAATAAPTAPLRGAAALQSPNAAPAVGAHRAAPAPPPGPPAWPEHGVGRGALATQAATPAVQLSSPPSAVHSSTHSMGGHERSASAASLPSSRHSDSNTGSRTRSASALPTGWAHSASARRSSWAAPMDDSIPALYPRTSAGSAADEELARRLQAQFDSEAAQALATGAPMPTPRARVTPLSPLAAGAAAVGMRGAGGLVSPPSSGHAKSPSAPPLSADYDVSASKPGEEQVCVICMAAPQEAGFLHGSTVHRCCCKGCAQKLKDNGTVLCPLCRKPIDHVILAVY